MARTALRATFALPLAGLLAACGSSAQGTSWLTVENARAGSSAWRLEQPATVAGQVEGYAKQVSVDRGEPVALALNAAPPRRVGLQVFRMGHYGGAGGRLVAQVAPFEISEQPAPILDLETGLIEARWATTLVLQTRDEDGPWPAGAYLVKLQHADGPQSYVPFVIRDDARDADVALQLSTATWQAYNPWGGESLYGSEHGVPGGKAVKVSFDRPYDPSYGFGSGLFHSLELPAVQWLESRGYDVEYTTSNDVGGREERLGRPRIFISVGHDEYASREAFDRLERALADGVSLAFLSGNTWYWAVRFEGAQGMSCYKDRWAEDPLLATDPSRTTGRWRDPPLSRPESGLIGLLSNGDALASAADWVVRSPEHWIYAGTGLRDGERLPGVVFFEWDALPPGDLDPSVTVVAESPVAGLAGPGRHHAVVRQRGGAFVFSAGTNYFARRLADERVATMLANVLSRAGAYPR